ncbi:hypothetical protein Lfu02_73030 [Longispora fulva]|uniref:Methyl-accepting chemotaxis protein n=1 Tax=Longispora fulva TaxID=619741 RepID=A0A8J7GNK9_9ACTN|nr:hypothetical protein [Longispora fulva]MBG6133891.1 methyl-accepting chemotaxis protein [Longispora fulva]GIG62931.1 hypothetical protein Lfu02_73030 [Longispora fulva]
MTSATAPREQHNHGSGTFIAGNVRIESMDAKTKEALTTLCEKAPQLGDLLARALRDGVISPDTVRALEAASNNINNDVAEALWAASRNIDHDVAEAFWAVSRNINPQVADQLSYASSQLNQEVADKISNSASSLNEAATTIEQALSMFQSASNTLSSTQASRSGWKAVADSMNEAATNMTMASQRHAQIGWSWKSFYWGMSASLTSVIIILLLAYLITRNA